MSLKLGLLTISRFCDLQSVKDIDRMVLVKMFGATEVRSYKAWYDDISLHFQYYEKRVDFYNAGEQTEEEAVKTKNNKKQKI